jgi:hypothetical protein
MQLGPFTTKLDKYLDIDISARWNDQLDMIGFSIPKMADDFLQDMGAITPDITVDSALVYIDWVAEIRSGNSYFEISDIYIQRVRALINLEIIVPDPLDDDKWETYEHEWEFETGDEWEIEADVESTKLQDGAILPQSIEMDVELKKIKIEF